MRKKTVQYIKNKAKDAHRNYCGRKLEDICQSLLAIGALSYPQTMKVETETIK